MSLVGSRIEDLDTPALLLDGPASERNLARMAAFFRGRPCQLRPHFKNHKCVALARRQLAAGQVVGFTAAKLGEAEVLADAGFNDVLIANQVVGQRKLQRLVALAKRIRLGVAFDHIDQAAAIDQAARDAGATVHLLLEVDIGMGRCGVQPGEPALALMRQTLALPGAHLATDRPRPGICFGGIQSYEGHLVGINDPADRAAKVRASFQLAIDTLNLLQRSGIPCPLISGGATATYATTGTLEGVREIQAGSYATMDWRYHQVAPEFEIALSVLCRVISRPRPDGAVLDIGVKGAGAEFGLPRIRGFDLVEIPWFLAEEHVLVNKVPDSPAWRVGSAVHLIPSHACSTCNLHRQLIVHDGQRVLDLWPIEASGKLA